MKTKRIVSSVLAALMLATSVPQTAIVSRYATVYADKTETPEGISYDNRVLTAKHTIEGAVSYKYQWVTKSDTDSDYHEYPTETNEKYYVTPRDKNMTLNCYVTGLDAEGAEIGETVLAGDDYRVASLGSNGRTDDSTAFTNETTPAEYKFRTRNYGREYILLDESYDGDDDSAFYVMTDWLGQQMVFDTAAETIDDETGKVIYGYYFNPDSETNIGYKLNNNQWLPENWVFDTDMENYINKNHVWWTETGTSNWVKEDYSFKAGFSLLAVSEAVKYREKIGWNLRTKAWWWTRSQRNNANTPVNILCCKGATTIWDVPINQDYKATNGKPLLEAIPFTRPTFYLKNDFFKNVRLRVFEDDKVEGTKVLGDEVCKMLVRRYTRDELAAIGYTDDELAAIGYEAPKGATVTLAKGVNTIGAVTYTATIEGDTSGATEYKYQWLTSADNTTWVELPTETTNEYSISSKDRGQYLNCRVTPVADGAEAVTAKPGVQITALGKQSRLGDDQQSLFPKDTPAQYKFSVGGKEYILLDRFNDTNSAYFVMTESYVGDKEIPFDTVATATKFAVDNDSQNNIGYKLNSGLSENKINNETIDERIISHINKEQVWWTEPGNDGNITSDYSVKAGVSLISMTELLKYFGKFGSALNGANYSWWTRTQRDLDNDTNKVNIMMVRFDSDSTKGFVNEVTDITSTRYDNRDCVARPVFYLNDKFFKEVKVDVTNSSGEYVLGDDVRAEIARVNSDEELLTLGYTSQEISYIHNGVIAKVTLEKANSAGAQTITATVSDNKTGIEEYSYQWVTSSDNKTWVELPTETNNVYRVSSRDKNQYIACKVIFGNDEPIEVQSSKSEQITDLDKQNRLSNDNQAIFADTTPSQYKFTVGDREYILLDRFNDENSAYYIMSEGYFGKIKDSEGKATGTPFDQDVTKVKLDPESPTNIAYKLNNEIDNNKINGEAIDKNIVDHINKSYKWWTERGNTEGIKSDYDTTMAVGLLSMSEANKYIEKIGVKPNGENVFWWVRTQRGQAVDTANVMVGKPGSPNSIDSIEMKEGLSSEIGYGPASYVSDNRSLVARPTFYLDSDFFKEVKVTVFDSNKNKVLGEDVRKEIVRVNPTAEALEKVGYEANEIAAILYPDTVDAISMADSDFNIYNRSDLKFDVNLEASGEVRITYSNGKGTKEDFDSSNLSGKQTYNMNELPNGTNHVEIKIFVDDVLKSVFYKTLYVVPDVSTTYNGVRPGIGLHLYNMQVLKPDADFITAAHKLGFNDIRLGWTWSRAENENGYSFEEYKPFMDKAKELNMNITQNLSYNLKKYSGSENDKDAIDTEAERTAFANYAKALVTEFKDYPNMKKVEVWNEPNATSFWNNNQENSNPQTAAEAKNYTDLVKAVSDAVKSVKPDITVYGGAIDVSRDELSDDTSNTRYGYTKEMFKNGVYNSMDVLSFHPYNHGTYSLDSFVKKSILPYEDVILDNGGFKKLAATEFGQSTDENGEDAEKQAREVPKAFVQLMAYGVENSEFFNFMDTEEAFGLFDKDGKAKDLLYTVAQVNNILDGAMFIGNCVVSGEDGAETEQYVFEKDNKLICVCWLNKGQSIGMSTAGGTAYDSFGNEIKPVDGYISVGQDINYIVCDLNAEGMWESLQETLLTAKEEEVKSRATKRFGDKLPQDIFNKTWPEMMNAIDESSMTEVEKSSFYSLYFDYIAVQSNIVAAGAEQDELAEVDNETSYLLEDYSKLCTSANASDNAYAKAVLKYAEEYFSENEKITSAKKKYANNININYLMLVAETMLKPLGVSKIENNAENTQITITLKNKEGKEFDLFVATYADDGTLANIKAFDHTSENYVADYDKDKVNKVFVWDKGTMAPIDCCVYTPNVE